MSAAAFIIVCPRLRYNWGPKERRRRTANARKFTAFFGDARHSRPYLLRQSDADGGLLLHDHVDDTSVPFLLKWRALDRFIPLKLMLQMLYNQFGDSFPQVVAR